MIIDLYAGDHTGVGDLICSYILEQPVGTPITATTTIGNATVNAACVLDWSVAILTTDVGHDGRDCTEALDPVTWNLTTLATVDWGWAWSGLDEDLETVESDAPTIVFGDIPIEP
ncbi:MAG: hypothetical protein JRI25_23790 [Deltaproteobacteria bacterium]|nr:hypothetical protein [Deltaproteobacteria bacterium]